MSQARHAILAKLRAGKKSGKTDKPTPLYSPWLASDEATRLTRFCTQLTANHAQVHQCQAADLQSQIHDIVTSMTTPRIATGTQGQYLAKIREGCQSADIVPFIQPIERWKESLFSEIDIGITHTHAAIADTGTLVLWPDSTEPRTLSLVPPCHLALVNASDIADNFADLIQAQDWHHGLPTNVVLISGPSKTADIQQTLAYGAHGPRQLIVIVLTDR
ncbi:lactate utilization protein (plasmid) [Photobacterium sp. GJ3]|uniref:LutC/YkgG family protein n=1 Tax=Photobacterium sp. GJ3 TaxID=2829502 RepID=UPI001B8BF183|nr:lactate utilization protein [Photobacterium sp. GJ3]QUJ69886.1 lactate utilization protein [Photobacterium sp. GJ3]